MAKISSVSACSSPSKYSRGRRGSPVRARNWKYSSGRPATPVAVSASQSRLLPVRGVEQIRYEVCGSATARTTSASNYPTFVNRIE